MAAAANGKTEKFVLTKDAKAVVSMLIGKGAVRTADIKKKIPDKAYIEAYKELRKYGDKLIKPVVSKGVNASIQLVAKAEQIADEVAPSREIKTRAPRGSKQTVHVSVHSSANGRSILQIGASEKKYLRDNIRSYLAFATGIEARKHEERRQADDSIDRVAGRAKEIRAEAKASGRPMTAGDAIRQAQAEVDMPFETLLQVKWMPIMFEIFGMFDEADTDQKTMRT